MNMSTTDVLDNQRRKRPEKPAVISKWQGATFSYQKLYETSQDIAASLLAHGVRAADRVMVLAGNSVEYVQLFFAVGGIGAIFAILNPTFTTEETLAAVDFLNPRAIFISERIGYRKNHDLVAALTNKPAHTKLLVVQVGNAGRSLQGVLSWNEFIQNRPDSATALDEHWGKNDPDEALCLQFTSGTTGARKGALLTHRNLINNAFLVGNRLSFSVDDILACCPPLFHCFGLVCGVLATITHGATVILPSEVFNADASLRAVTEDACTVINAVPTMFQAMLDQSQGTGLDTSGFRLRTGIIAGSSLSETLLQRLDGEFGLRGLAYAFGMTELSAVSFMTSPTQVSLLEERSSVGTLLPHTSAKVVDSDLLALPPGSRGELLVAGDLVFKGYYRDPEKTGNAVAIDTQGRRWLRTGDIVELSSSGSCTVVGRTKDMIKRGGENIAPRDIESVLELHPAIEAAAVVGVPNARWGEDVCAFVQRKQDDNTNQDSHQAELQGKLNTGGIKTWLRKQIAPHKVPQYVFWVGEDAGVPERLPVNSSGKVLKRELSSIATSLVR
ncbi:putative Amp dependent CoA ligase [Seiridium cardinale]|uniref:Amp dependent CoA ligase n=1 Tax=Seiridium cardinale TaxID=138064 RepID=A0ABR2XA03_9PEZI